MSTEASATDRSERTVYDNPYRESFWRFLPVIYVLSVVPIVVFLSMFRQPIGVADEWSHIARAAQLADGRFLTEVAEAGKPPLGSIDPNFLQLTNAVHARRHEPMATLLPDLARLRWGTDRQLANYNSSVYFPAPYLLTVAALKIGQAAGSSIVDTLRLANLLNGLAYALVTALAIAVAPRGKAVIVAVAVLPMSLYLFASASPDGPLISSALLAFALVVRSGVRRESSAADFAALTVLSIVIVATKLPYLPLSAAAILAMWLASPVRRPSWIVPAVALFAVLGVSVGWSIVTKAGAIDVTWGSKLGDPAGQVAFLLRHPGAALVVASNTLGESGWAYLQQMVGFLGWQDAPISPTGQSVFLGLLAAALVLDGAAVRSGWAKALIALGLLASAGAVFLSLYVAATPVGSLDPIVGVQGRYFLPLVAFVAVLLPSAVGRRWSRWPLCVALVVSIPFSGFEIMQTVLNRYYM